MATSQNGWLVFQSGTSPLLVAIPKILGRVRKGDVATVFTYLVNRFDREVEDVDAGRDDWGYAYRPVRGKSSGYSNHASGTAIDLNATQHPLGKVNTFSVTQRARIRSILRDLGGVIRWGGDYSGRKDEMHFEINANAARVKQVADKLRGGSLVDNPISGGSGSIDIPNVPSIPVAPKDWFDMADEKTLVEAVKKAFNTPEFRNEVYKAAWVYPQWTVPGTDRTENPGQFLAASRLAAVQAVHAAAEAEGLSEDAVQRIVNAVSKVSAADVAGQLETTTTISVKE